MQLTGQPEAPAGEPPLGSRLSAWGRIVRSAAIVRRKLPANRSEGEFWAVKLKEVIAELEDLNRSTERGFLGIGRKLSEFKEKVKLISSELAALAGLLSGKRGPQAAEALTRALERATAMSVSSEESRGLLGIMRHDAGRLGKTLAGFKGTLAHFHLIGVLTRVETARLGRAGADFGNLANEVSLLAGNIQTRIEGALDTAAELIAPIESVLQRVAAIEEGRATDLPRVISGVLASLESFRDLRERTSGASARLVARYSAISKAFDDLIVSIQFHDITRQQVEHVIEILRQFLSHPPADPAAILELQSMQLADAGKKFSASVAAITHNLDQIAENVSAMANESQTLSGLSEDQKNSLFQELERGLSAILAGFSVCAEAEAATQVASSGLAETIHRMQGAIDEIRAIEIHIQRMAINASIRASHIGAAGDALGVLADSVQKLSLESGRCSEALATALGSMTRATSRLARPDRPRSDDGDGTGDDTSGAMRAAVAGMHLLTESSFAQIAQIVSRGQGLNEALVAAREGLLVGNHFGETIVRVREMLHESAAECAAFLPRGHVTVLGGQLADVTKHYTMQAEHDVHRGLSQIAAGATFEAEAIERSGTFSEDASGLGDNVELF